jgi:aspartyl-tRNA(Asn)/glutamyl-tRNA(Gln) amidotransferase subunit C
VISKKDVEHVANLARIELTEEEKEKFTKQLGDIIKYVDQLNEVDTTNIDPMAHPYLMTNVMREDEVKYSNTKEELLQNAPEEEDGFFKVPKIN